MDIDAISSAIKAIPFNIHIGLEDRRGLGGQGSCEAS
jgi:hypothetical protein